MQQWPTHMCTFICAEHNFLYVIMSDPTDLLKLFQCDELITKIQIISVTTHEVTKHVVINLNTLYISNSVNNVLTQSQTHNCLCFNLCIIMTHARVCFVHTEMLRSCVCYLTHELWNNSVKDGALVPISMFTSTQSSEVLYRENRSVITPVQN